MQNFHKNRKKFTKIFACTSLALITCATTLLAVNPFTPQTARAETLDQTSTQTTQSGLITPKADDPVLFTTQSGIEIKWGNALPSTYNTSLTSGSLHGFPYFTTNDGTTTYNWVIIGQSSDSLNFIRNCISVASMQTNQGIWGEYFFNNQYEDTTPMGSAIATEIVASYVADSLMASDEIPENHVLCLANDIVGSGVANTTSAYKKSSTGTLYYRGHYVGELKTTMDSYYTNSSFGLSSIKNQIASVSLTTYGLDSSELGAGAFRWISHVVTSYVFPLASSNSVENSFKFDTYLSAEEMKISSNQWFRDGRNSSQSGWCAHKFCMNASGEVTYEQVRYSSGYRPAFVMSLA